MWCKIKVHRQTPAFKDLGAGGSAPLQNQRTCATRLTVLMLLQSTADTAWLALLLPPTPPPQHSDVSSTQRLTQHFSHAWLVDQRGRQECNRARYPLLSWFLALSLKIKHVYWIKKIKVSWPCGDCLPQVSHRDSFFINRLRVATAFDDSISKL